VINVEIKDGKIVVEGNDNHQNPRQEFVDRLHALDDDGYVNQAETVIWLSAFANNNPRSDYHWQADVCYKEANLRGKPELYVKAYDQARATAGC
jgi:hypothetical protein